jgi:hypothetical protein
MHGNSLRSMTTRVVTALGAALLLVAGIAVAQDSSVDIARWLGKEITIQSSSVNDLVPIGGKFTLIYDAEDNTVRICTRSVASQRGQWRMDMVPGCNVALAVTRGERFCTLEDVKAGNAEVLSACHRLRSHDIALRPSAVKGTVELNDVIVFPVEAGNDGKLGIAILIDSPSRVTDGGIIWGKQ